MSSGQVSVWVPLGVAVLGIVGVVLAQVVNARRTDRRERAAASREDVRFWRDRILTIFTDCHVKADEWILSIHDYVDFRFGNDDRTSPEMWKKCQQDYEATRRAVAQIALVFGDDSEVGSLAENMFWRLFKIHEFVGSDKTIGSQFHNHENADTPLYILASQDSGEAWSDQAAQTMGQLHKAMRRCLGLDHVLAAVTPSPPSGTTS